MSRAEAAPVEVEAAGGLFLIVPLRPAPELSASLGEALSVPGCVGVLLAGDPSAAPESVAAARAVCTERAVAFFLDGAEATIRHGADGTLLPAPDGVAEARTRLGQGRLLGVACGLSRHEAMEAGDAGADFIAFGDLDRPASSSLLELLAWWQELFVLPGLALATVTGADDVTRLHRAGADFVAVRLEVLEETGDPAAAMQRLGASYRGR